MSNPKSIILTGASRGIGLAIARFLLKEGHKVFLVARSEEPMEKLRGEFKGQVEYLAADLSDFKVSDLFSYQLRCCHVRIVSLGGCHVFGRELHLEAEIT
jgi:short-subunit dehydrogenase